MKTVSNKYIVENINNGHRVEVFASDWDNPKKWNKSLKRAYQVVSTLNVALTPEVAALVLPKAKKDGNTKPSSNKTGRRNK